MKRTPMMALLGLSLTTPACDLFDEACWDIDEASELAGFDVTTLYPDAVQVCVVESGEDCWVVGEPRDAEGNALSVIDLHLTECDDTGDEDTGSVEDTGSGDTGTADTGGSDTGIVDTGDTGSVEDTGSGDTGTADTGGEDTGSFDTGDTGSVEDTGDTGEEEIEDADGDGYTVDDGDCDDSDSDVNPGATEACNQVDDDCDGDVNEDLSQDCLCVTGSTVADYDLGLLVNSDTTYWVSEEDGTAVVDTPFLDETDSDGCESITSSGTYKVNGWGDGTDLWGDFLVGACDGGVYEVDDGTTCAAVSVEINGVPMEPCGSSYDLCEG